jgi:hypothetical protein
MKLTSYGDSFIFGTDLADAEMIPNTSGKPSQHTWPALLAQHLGYQYRCRAYPGCGNLLIAERLFANIDQLLEEHSTVIIGWTWIDRFDYNDIRKKDSWETIRPVDETTVAKIYYQELHSEYRDKLTSLMTIKLTIDTLKQNNIPFVMTYMDELLFDQQWHTSNSIDYLQNYIRPYMTTFEGQTFLDWSRDRNYPIGPGGHPIEQAHLEATDYMIKVFDKQNTIDR